MRSGNDGFKRQLKNSSKWCEVADEPVVVSKSRPVKAGNSLEDKTVTTSDKANVGNSREFRWTTATQTVIVGCEGGKFYCGLEKFDFD